MNGGAGGGFLLAGAVIGAAVILGYVVYWKVKKKAERFALEAFGVRSVREGLKAQAERLEETPKSVMAMTKVFLPQIMRDFPEFDWPQFRAAAEEEVKSFLKRSGKREIKIHQTEIARYVKQAGICTVIIQSAAGYKEEAPEQQTGERKVQSRISAELSYIQDIEKITPGVSGISLTCPQCGAPVTKLGSKFCEYCGCGIVPVNSKVWKFMKVYEDGDSVR